MERKYIPVASLTDRHAVDLGGIEEWLMLCPEGECGDCDGTRISIEFEYSVVFGTEEENDECVRVDTEVGSFGLPPDLLVEVIEMPLDNGSGL